MLGTGELVAFAATRDLGLSHAFYGDVLGLERVDASSFANVYTVAGTALRVTLVEDVVRAPYTVLDWNVPDICARRSTRRLVSGPRRQHVVALADHTLSRLASTRARWISASTMTVRSA
jgi:hypothetical protein